MKYRQQPKSPSHGDKKNIWVSAKNIHLSESGKEGCGHLPGETLFSEGTFFNSPLSSYLSTEFGFKYQVWTRSKRAVSDSYVLTDDSVSGQ